MKLPIAVFTVASFTGIAAACLTNVYDACVHYIPKSDSDPVIQCDSQQTCVDACDARTGKCEKLVKEGTLIVSCAKLSGNFYSYCVAYETNCRIKLAPSAGFDDLFSTNGEQPVALPGTNEGYAHQNLL